MNMTFNIGFKISCLKKKNIAVTNNTLLNQIHVLSIRPGSQRSEKNCEKKLRKKLTKFI